MVSLENFDSVNTRQVYFEQTITRLVTYWSEHEAIQNVDVEFLDEEKDNILNIINLALEISVSWKSTFHLIYYFDSYMEFRGEWETWQNILDKAISKANQHQDNFAEATCTHMLAYIYRLQNKPKETVQLYRHVIHLAKVCEHRYLEAKAYTDLGVCYENTGYWWRAEVLHCHALKICEELERFQMIGIIHNNLAAVYIHQEKWQEAEHCLKLACKIHEEKNGDFNQHLIYPYNNLGYIYNSNGSNQFDLAISYLQKAIDYADLIGDLHSIGQGKMNLGVSFFKQGRLSEAEEQYRQAEEIFETCSKTNDLADIRHHLGEVCQVKEDYHRACEYFEFAAKELQNSGTWRDEIKSRISLAECQILVEDYAKAIKHLSRIEALWVNLDAKTQQKHKNKINELYDALRAKDAQTSELDKRTRALNEN